MPGNGRDLAERHGGKHDGTDPDPLERLGLADALPPRRRGEDPQQVGRKPRREDDRRRDRKARRGGEGRQESWALSPAASLGIAVTLRHRFLAAAAVAATAAAAQCQDFPKPGAGFDEAKRFYEDSLGVESFQWRARALEALGMTHDSRGPAILCRR